MSFVVREPGAGLAPFVKSFWLYRGEHALALERVLPGVGLQLLVNLDGDSLTCRRGDDWRDVTRIGGIGVVGLRSGPAAIDPREQRRIAGVAFRPGGAWPFFGAPMDELRDREVDLGDLWGPEARVLRDAMGDADDDGALDHLQRALLRRWPGNRQDPSVAHAVRTLGAGARVDATAERLGTSAATLRRRFLSKVGTTPKVFARVARLGRTLRSLGSGPPTSWAAFAVEQGFVDQSHLIRELRDLGGLTPTEYAPREPGETLHVVID